SRAGGRPAVHSKESARGRPTPRQPYTGRVRRQRCGSSVGCVKPGFAGADAPARQWHAAVRGAGASSSQSLLDTPYTKLRAAGAGAADPGALAAGLRAIAGLLTDRELVQERLAGGVGDVVRIVGGPLTGFTGTVVRAKPNKWQLVLEVSFLGARREVEVDERM